MSLDRDVFGKEKRFKIADAKFKARTDDNGRAILSYVDSKRMNISPRRLIEYYVKIGLIDKLLNGKKFKELEKDDLIELFFQMKQRDGYHGHKLSTRSLNNYKKELRSFLRFLGKIGLADEIKLERMDELNNLTPEDMLLESDAEAAIRAAGTERNRAIIALYAETGMRPSELFNVQIKDLNLNSQVKSIVIFGKKRKRHRPIIGCVPYLSAWLNVHPKASDPEAPLFVKKNGQPLPYFAVNKLIKVVFARAGIKKPAMAKLFRHSTNTFLFSKYPQEIMGAMQGHAPGSKMAAHYSHMGKDMINEKYASLYGLKPQEETKPFLMPKVCSICNLENTAEKTTCERCKNPLTLKSALELTNPNKLIQDALSSDNQLMAQLEEKLVERIMSQIEKKLRVEIKTNGKNGPEEI